MRHSFLSLAFLLCTCGEPEGAPANVNTSRSALPEAQEVEGVFDIGPHGPVLTTDAETKAAKAHSKDGLWETYGVLVRVTDDARPEFRRVLAAAVAQGQSAGIHEYGMRLRVRLLGKFQALAVEASGFNREFLVQKIYSLRLVQSVRPS